VLLNSSEIFITVSLAPMMVMALTVNPGSALDATPASAHGLVDGRSLELDRVPSLFMRDSS
jgi:hypothetical protein